MQIQDLIQPGKKLKIFYSENNINNEIIEVRAVVDENQVVCRTWSKSKHQWVYRVENIVFFEMLLKEGQISPITTS